jgi:hypothetical protein
MSGSSRYFLLLIAAILLFSCSSLPVIHSSESDRLRNSRKCAQPYVEKPHRFIHSIEATIAGRSPATFLGITLVDPAQSSLHSALLTLEGLVLLEASYDKSLQVIRAVPPFDDIRFTRNIMEDIRLIFLPPRGGLLETGTRKDGSPVCRFDGGKGRTIDMIFPASSGWNLEAYADNHKLLRRVSADSIKNGIPERLELTGKALFDYNLKLKLISAEPVTAEELLKMSAGSK